MAADYGPRESIVTTLTAVQQEIVDAQQRLAVWTTATRPTPVTGEFLVGFNTTLGVAEYHDGSDWHPFSAPQVTEVASSGGSDSQLTTSYQLYRSATVTPRITSIAVGGHMDFRIRSGSVIRNIDLQLRLSDGTTIAELSGANSPRVEGAEPSDSPFWDRRIFGTLAVTPGAEITVQLRARYSSSGGHVGVLTYRGGLTVMY